MIKPGYEARSHRLVTPSKMDEEVAVKSYRSLELCPPVKIPRKSLVVELIGAYQNGPSIL